MSTDGLAGRGRSLGEAFFRREAEGLRETLQSEDEEARRELASASGIGDDEVLRRLTALGIRVDTLAALTLVPLVEVAWADGRMDRREREAILRGALDSGIREESWSYRLLRIWTEDRPDPELFRVWHEFTQALGDQLSDAERSAFRSKIVGRARQVAEAAAGLLGLGPRVSASEEGVLARLDAAFDA